MKSDFFKKMKFGTEKLFGYFLWLMILILIFSMIRNVGKVFQTRYEIEKEREKIEKMKEVNANLEKAFSEAQSSSFIEKQVRDKLGLAKVGEAIVILPEQETVKKLAPQIKNEQDSLPDPNWKKWMKLFF